MYLILGMGRSGQAATIWLQDRNEKVITCDDDPKKGEDSNTIPWDEITAVIQSPGIPYSLPKPHAITAEALSRNIPILSDINLLRQSQDKAAFIGITGTNGKSTTTALIGHILKANKKDVEVGGNIGIPALSLPQLRSSSTYVLELSSYQLEFSSSLNLNIAAWLNISEDHLERHGSMDGYVKAKMRIFEGCQKATIGIDDSYSLKVYEQISKQIQTLSVSVSPLSSSNTSLSSSGLTRGPADIWVSQGTLFDGGSPAIDLNFIPTLKGKHNHQNAAIAYATMRLHGLSTHSIQNAMVTFPGLAHRLEIVSENNNILFVNDSKATNADATAKALDTYQDASIYWIAGGRPKSNGITPLIPYFSKIKHAFLIGEAEADFPKTLDSKASYSKCGDLNTAVERAFDMAQKDNSKQAVILFSPACASFDQFKDFEHRGEVFRNLVRSLL